jgi:hypothetical protein
MSNKYRNHLVAAATLGPPLAPEHLSSPARIGRQHRRPQGQLPELRGLHEHGRCTLPRRSTTARKWSTGPLSSCGRGGDRTAAKLSRLSESRIQ